MAKKPHELLELVKPWGIERETREFMKQYLARKDEVKDIDSWIRDRRTAEQFSEQMLAYWAVEDAFSIWLERNLRNKYPRCKVHRTGTDKDRRIIEGQSPRGKVTGEPDYEVELEANFQPIMVEFQFGAVELDAYDIKINKVNKAKKLDGIILFAFLPQNKFTIMTPDFIEKFGEKIVNSRFGGKFTWNVKASKIRFKDKDYKITKEDLSKGFV